MILERSSHNLESDTSNGDVFLEGIFAQFGVVNNNDRLYEEAEYLPHLEYLQKKIKENRLLGELDHPEKFDISLSKTSHVIEMLEYDKGTRQLRGKVKLLDTPSGRIAKDLVRAGVPISISSRAAGLVESNKKVKIKKIFTYDLVADPGFENAVLSKMNESLGISNDSQMIAVYDMTGKYPELLEDTTADVSQKTEASKTNKQTNMEFVTADEMNQYSLFVKEEIEKLHSTISSLNEKNVNSELSQKFSGLNESVEKVQKYLDYLATTSDKSIQYTEYIAERLDKVIEYTNYVAKTLDESIRYTEQVAEKSDQGIQYTEYLKEQLENGIKYSEYLKEQLEKTVDYAEHIAEKSDQGIQYSESLAEKLDQAISYSEYLGESLEKGVAYSEYVSEQAQAVADYVEFSLNEGKVEGKAVPIKESKVAPQHPSLVAKQAAAKATTTAKPVAKPTNISESKTTSKDKVVIEKTNYELLPNKVDQLIESIKKQKVEKVDETLKFGFTKLLSEAKREAFRLLDETKKQKVASALSGTSAKTEEEISKIWEAALTPHVEKWIEEAPAEYKQLWESLDEKSKKTIAGQSRSYKLETAYQIKNFWETRPASILKKADSTPINESVEVKQPATPSSLGYSTEHVKMVGDLLGKFKK